MHDLVEFLKARIDEDERIAKAATPGPWHWEGDYPEGFCPHGDEWTDHGPDLNSGEESVLFATGYDNSSVHIADADANHIAHYDPARVLREIEAARAILDHHARYDPLGDAGDYPSCAVCDANGPNSQTWPCKTIRLMASRYSDHPDYKPEWSL